LTKQTSTTTVSSCHNFESTVFCKVGIRCVWDTIKKLDFATLIPSKVEKVDGKVAVGETVIINFKDKSVWTVRILELSELNHFITWEVIETNPSIHVASVVNTVRLTRVTDCGSTFLSWETEFSNDADVGVVQDNKYKKLEYFAEMKKHFGDKCTKA